MFLGVMADPIDGQCNAKHAASYVRRKASIVTSGTPGYEKFALTSSNENWYCSLTLRALETLTIKVPVVSSHVVWVSKTPGCESLETITVKGEIGDPGTTSPLSVIVLPALTMVLGVMVTPIMFDWPTMGLDAPMILGSNAASNVCPGLQCTPLLLPGQEPGPPDNDSWIIYLGVFESYFPDSNTPTATTCQAVWAGVSEFRTVKLNDENFCAVISVPTTVSSSVPSCFQSPVLLKVEVEVGKIGIFALSAVWVPSSPDMATFDPTGKSTVGNKDTVTTLSADVNGLL
jgi:hypothetical protein